MERSILMRLGMVLPEKFLILLLCISKYTSLEPTKSTSSTDPLSTYSSSRLYRILFLNSVMFCPLRLSTLRSGRIFLENVIGVPSPPAIIVRVVVLLNELFTKLPSLLFPILISLVLLITLFEKEARSGLRSE